MFENLASGNLDSVEAQALGLCRFGLRVATEIRKKRPRQFVPALTDVCNCNELEARF